MSYPRSYAAEEDRLTRTHRGRPGRDWRPGHTGGRRSARAIVEPGDTEASTRTRAVHGHTSRRIRRAGSRMCAGQLHGSRYSRIIEDASSDGRFQQMLQIAQVAGGVGEKQLNSRVATEVYPCRTPATRVERGLILGRTRWRPRHCRNGRALSDEATFRRINCGLLQRGSILARRYDRRRAAWTATCGLWAA